MSDNDELQEILQHEVVVPPKPESNLGIALNDIAESLNEAEKVIPTEYTQWVVLPNGVFQATGATTEHLPVGAYTLAITPSGISFTSKKILTDTLIDLGNSNSLKVINNIKLFWTKKKQYQDKGILYKRGVLMWGPPGSGKTATLTLLIKDLIDQGGIVLLVQQPDLATRALQQLRKIEPERPLIVVLEDVDEIITNQGEHDLLALLDGEHHTDNVVNIATTNYPEKLGSRIVNRPSRFDEVIKIGMPSDRMRRQYLQHLLKGETNYPIDEWVKVTENMSIAHLKELVIAITVLEQPYDEVIARLKTMKMVPKSSIFDNEMGFK